MLEEILDGYERAPPAWLNLATLASLAVRVTPALLRALRLEHCPGLGAGAESRVWHSPLADEPSPLGFGWVPEAAHWLRARLQTEGQLEAAWTTMQRVHDGFPPLFRAEERLTYLALQPQIPRGDIDRILRSLTRAAANPARRPGLYAWTLRAFRRLPSAVGESAQAHVLQVIASEAKVDLNPESLGELRELDRQETFEQLPKIGLELSEDPSGLVIADRGRHLLVPDTEPRILYVRGSKHDEARTVQIPTGGRSEPLALGGELELVSLEGQRWQLTPRAHLRHVQPLLDAADQGRLVLCVGPELSERAGLPTHQSVATLLLEFYAVERPEADLSGLKQQQEEGASMALLEQLGNLMGMERMREFVELTYRGPEEVTLPPVVKDIRALQRCLHRIYTTSIEPTLAAAFSASQWELHVGPKAPEPDEEGRVCPLFGMLDDPDSWVLTSSEAHGRLLGRGLRVREEDLVVFVGFDGHGPMLNLLVGELDTQRSYLRGDHVVIGDAIAWGAHLRGRLEERGVQLLPSVTLHWLARLLAREFDPGPQRSSTAPEVFYGYTEVLSAIDHALRNEATARGVLLVGDEGTGKTALLDHWLGLPKQRGDVVVSYFVEGHSGEHAAEARRHLSAQLERAFPWPAPLDLDGPSSLLRALRRANAEVQGSEGKVIVVLDGLDADNWAAFVDLIPETPPCVFVIYGARTSDGMSRWQHELGLVALDLEDFVGARTGALREFWTARGATFAYPMSAQEIEDAVLSSGRSWHSALSLAEQRERDRLPGDVLEGGSGGQEVYFFNGINGLTGEPLLPPMGPEEIATLVDPSYDSSPDVHVGRSFGLSFGMNPSDLGDAGWTIVFAQDEGEEVHVALEPLIEHRRASGALVRVLTVSPEESFASFMARHGVYPGEIDPENIGYYLLIIGSPERIGWEFQSQASIDYAVGRLDLDSPDDYARYARSVIEAESEWGSGRVKRLSYWGPRHDPHTELSYAQILIPLIEGEAREQRKPRPPIAEQLKWETSAFLGIEATKDNFIAALEQRPALMFTVSHGIGGFRPGSEEQHAFQGALLSADWGGPGWMSRADYVSADDISDELELGGMIAFHLASYAGGTPERASFRHREERLPIRLAKPEFVAALPRRMLSHPRGSALAVIAPVGRVWGGSFKDESGRHLGPFRSALGLIMSGQPVGQSIKGFNERYAALSSQVSSLVETRGFGREIDARALARTWLARNDVRSYVVLGDPGVRLNLK